MITAEQLANLKPGDKVKHTYVPRGKKRPVTSVMAYADRQEEGKITLQSIGRDGKPIFGFYFVYAPNDEKLSVG